MKITIAQLNPKVGDIDANLALIRKARAMAASADADLIIYGELVVSGYPPEDLVKKTSFQKSCKKAVMDLAADTKDGGPAMLISAPWAENGKLYNAALLLDGGELTSVIAKCKLPNYGVFDEVRLFDAGPCPIATEFRGHKIGIMTCEDMWDSAPTKSLVDSGAELLVVLNASPFEIDKPNDRIKLATQRAKESGLALVYVNQVGGQDELVFDGASFVMDAKGKLKSRLASFVSSIETISFSSTDGLEPIEATINIDMGKDEAIYSALVMGLRDYVNKNFFPGVMIGLSGGVDSALSAAIAVDALGAERVHCVMMPSPYTSKESLDDAAETARLLGVRLDTISIEP
ncbi:MAG: NAD+ synthase, partial [Rhodospirillaceae bacterium]|nr:NAD+ synthase [Rhodospirillaceae bacterium]